MPLCKNELGGPIRGNDATGVSIMNVENKYAYRDRIREFPRSIAIPMGLAGLSVGAGTVGYSLHLSTHPAYHGVTTVQILTESLFRSLGFLVLSMGTVESASSLPYVLITLGRFFGLLFFSYAAVAGLSWVFAEQLRPLRIDLWSALEPLPGYDDRGHVIVCGVGDDGYAIANEALDNGRNVVAIDTTRSDQTSELKKNGAIVFEGDASHSGMLIRRARLHRASDVFVTTGSDTTNGAIVETINRWASDDSRLQVVDVTARITDRRFRQTLHEETSTIVGCHLRTYDVEEATARELLATYPVDDIDDSEQRVHVWIVGWTPLSKALVNQLLHLMHYPECIDRKLTVITHSPGETERDITTLSPGIDSDWWEDESMGEFVDELFPDIAVQSMPVSDMELLSNQSSLYDSLENHDKLTIFADHSDERSLRALVSVWEPKLADVTRDLNLDTRLVYRGSDDTNAVQTDDVQITTFTDFTSGCSIRSVRGDNRDRVAKQLALVYHLLYEQNSSPVVSDSDPDLRDSLTDIESVVKWLDSLPRTTREQYASTVWRRLPESQRESNRHAADHSAVKKRMADVLAGANNPLEETVRAIAESEHRRWCAEKILEGWEPLPRDEAERWNTERGEELLREQRYHPDIRSTESLRAEMDGEWTKDVSQVKAVLNYPDIIGYRSSFEERTK